MKKNNGLPKGEKQFWVTTKKGCGYMHTCSFCDKVVTLEYEEEYVYLDDNREVKFVDEQNPEWTFRACFECYDIEKERFFAKSEGEKFDNPFL